MRVLGAACLLTISIASPAGAADLKKLDLINPGDTRARVIELMGVPGNRQFSDTREALQWCKGGLFSNTYALVVLHDGKVHSLKRATDTNPAGGCDKGYPVIDFVPPPDQTVEIRNR